MIDVEQAFNPETKSVHVVFQSPGIGYYIPLYQREYSWDKDNIEQLLFDISSGLENIIASDPNEIRFLGTLITVAEPNKKEKIKPQDPAGLPPTIEKVIDGQQRISTIALFATLIHDKFKSSILDKIHNSSPIKKEIEEVCKNWMDKLRDIYSFDLKRGTPTYKPKIIRGNQDAWTKDGKTEDYYFSDVTRYLAEYIGYDHSLNEKPKLNQKNSKVFQNLKQIDYWLINDVLKAHSRDDNEFPSSKDIIKKLNQEYIWSYERKELLNILISDSPNQSEYNIVSKVVQLSAVCHYLLDRCCFTIIQPRSDEWAFDLFQSLNATGTPLTAIETFHPLVVNHIENSHVDYKSSPEAKDFKKLNNLFVTTTTAAQKNKLTNDFLTSFAIVLSGEKLSTHFSSQRKWLELKYTSLETNEEKTSFINFMGNYASFYKNVWLSTEITNKIDLSEETKLQLAYLKDSNHKMAITALGYFYHLAIKDNSNFEEFSKVVRLITSFYTIWRSSSSNVGLDNAYRSFFKGEKRDTDSNGFNWVNNNNPSYIVLKNHFIDELKQREIFKYDGWLKKSQVSLNYFQSKSLCRYALFIYFNDTIEDNNNPGLLKKAKKETESFLSLRNWQRKKYKSIEHIAPSVNNGSWDDNLYDDEKIYDTIGNLTLLPIQINSMLSNGGWDKKQIIYRIIGEPDKEVADQTIHTLFEKGEISIELKEKLQELNERGVHKSISFLINSSLIRWNKDFIKMRTQNILEILWDNIKIDEEI